MPFREFEAMVWVPDEQELTAKLRDLGAELIHQICQHDCYYDMNYRLTKKDRLLRIRIEEALETHQFLAAEFSWKSGREGTQYEVREDISIHIESAEKVQALETILTRLGFKKLAWLTKHRDRWQLKEIEFEFDKHIQAQVINRPQINIGSFLQATIETEQEYSEAEMITLLWNALEKLGFERSQFRRESYIELYLHKLQENTSPKNQAI